MVGKEARPGSQIPVAVYRRQGSRESMSDGETAPWRRRYDLSEASRKETIGHYLRAVRDKEDAERALEAQRRRTEDLEDQLTGLKQQEAKLTCLSEAMVKEYDLLKNKHELETAALQQAVSRATQWYKQNRQLKRKSAVLMQKVLKVAPESLTDVDDEVDHTSDSDEIDTLRINIQEMQERMAKLQAELNCLRLQEFEAQEQIVDLTASLDAERSLNAKLQSQLEEVREEKANLDQVTRLAAQEVTALRDQYHKEKSTSLKFKSDADKATKERNVLAHQSQILLCEAASDERLMKALLEVETLKRSLEEAHQEHSDQVSTLKERLESQENESQKEFLEEKLKLVESELSIALQRAERAENESKVLQLKVSELETEVKERRVPPPPPPPPPLPGLLTCSSTGLPASRHKTSSVVEMANLLGIPRTAKPTLLPGAIDDIINEIKGGRFILKTPERQMKKKVEDEQPEALKEMMNVLGTLRKRQMNRSSFKRTKELAVSSAADITI